MAVNSNRKGSRGERAAVDYLKSLGFTDARRTQQYCGDAGDADVICPESLPNVFIEVKFGRKGGREAFIGTQEWLDAIDKARTNCPVGKHWCILFKPHGGKRWLLTLDIIGGPVVTLATDREIYDALILLNK